MREEDVLTAIREIVGAADSGRVLLGIGDDAAVWQPSRSNRSVVTSDMLIEGVHFSRDGMSLDDAGWRAMAANLSDLAAMGARPVLATIALGVPPAATLDDIRRLYGGLDACARAGGIAIAGGDLSRAPVLTIAITAIGEVRAGNLKTRSGGHPNDVLAVTGALGASRAGLELGLGRAVLSGDAASEALAAHRRPQARIREGVWLAASRHVRAMIDCSDGLSTDLARLCAACGTGAVVEVVPVAESARMLAEGRGLDPAEFALAGGEDFELLVAIEARAFAHLATRFRGRFGRRLYRVGSLRKAMGAVVRKGEREEPLVRSGWDHFEA